MSGAIPFLLLTLLSAGPAPVTTAPKAMKSKVYVVYVTVVEIDADGTETVLFTPRVQTTGNPAGVTVDHVDGRSFEFHCQLDAAPANSLKIPQGTPIGVSAANKTDRPVAKKEVPTVPTETIPVPPSPPLGSKTITTEKPAATRAAVSRHPKEFFIRTYDVSDLIEQPQGENPDSATPSAYAPLIQTLKAVAVPESWSGRATIQPFPSTKSLAIKQNEAGHQAVARALAELRPRKIEATDSAEEPRPK